MHKNFLRHKILTFETIHIMKAGWLWEASLVAEAVESFDTWQWPSAAFSRGYDGVAHTAIGQPARAATIQTFTPCQVQLCCCSKLCSCCSAVWLCFIKWQLLWDGVMKHLPYKHKIFYIFHYFILLYVKYVVGSWTISWVYDTLTWLILLANSSLSQIYLHKWHICWLIIHKQKCSRGMPKMSLR